MVPTPVVTVAAVADAFEGGSAGTFRITRTETAGNLGLTFSVQGTATLYADHGDAEAPYQLLFADGLATLDVTIPAVNDSTSEPTETVVLNILAGTGYTVGDPASATISIFDNDAAVVSVVKGADAAVDGENGSLRFTRLGDLSNSLTAYYTVGGTATADEDYEELSGQVTFAASEALAEVEVVAIENGQSDPPKTVVATLSTDTGYSLGSNTAATVEILTTALYTVSGGDWFNLGGTGSDTGWLVVGEDGGVWLATGPENDMEFASVANWDIDEDPATAYLVTEDEEDIPEPVSQPPEVAPPPRELPPVVSPLGSLQVGAWSLHFNQDGTIDIKRTSTNTTVATVLPDGSVKLYAGGTIIEIKPPKPPSP